MLLILYYRCIFENLSIFSIFIIIRRGSRSPKYAKHDQFTLFEFEDGCEIVQRFMRMHVHTATALLILTLFGDVIVAVPVVICLSSLKATTNTTPPHDRTGTTDTVPKISKHPQQG